MYSSGRPWPQFFAFEGSRDPAHGSGISVLHREKLDNPAIALGSAGRNPCMKDLPHEVVERPFSFGAWLPWVNITQRKPWVI